METLPGPGQRVIAGDRGLVSSMVGRVWHVFCITFKDVRRRVHTCGPRISLSIL
jgi:hypothetical protein